VVPVCMCGDTQPQGRAVVRGCQSPAAVVLFRGPPSPLLAPGRSRQRPGPPPTLSIPCQLCTFPCTFLHHTHWSPRPPPLPLSAADPAERERPAADPAHSQNGNGPLRGASRAGPAQHIWFVVGSSNGSSNSHSSL
jgi:hypothetical protein